MANLSPNRRAHVYALLNRHFPDLDTTGKRFRHHVAKRLIESVDPPEFYLQDFEDDLGLELAGSTSSQRIFKLHYYLKDHTIRWSDRQLHVLYHEALRASGIHERIPLSQLAGLGAALLTRLDQWLLSAGNDREQVLQDYIRVVFENAWKSEIKLRPRTLFGDWGWKTWIGWVNDRWGGLEGYVMPSAADYAHAQTQHALLSRWAVLVSDALQAGDLKRYEALQALASAGEEAMVAELERCKHQ